jgi:hypothetical protein
MIKSLTVTDKQVILLYIVLNEFHSGPNALTHYHSKSNEHQVKHLKLTNLQNDNKEVYSDVIRKWILYNSKPVLSEKRFSAIYFLVLLLAH